MNISKKFYEEEGQTRLLGKSKQDQYEMRYNYIFLQEIEAGCKINISRTLKDCTDIELFEQPAIQHIIDYKWDTYGRQFFLIKFYLYLVFLVAYIYDMESIHTTEVREGQVSDLRVKDGIFYAIKALCSTIQAIFMLYEFAQFRIEGYEYLRDPWNYLEVVGILIFFSAAALDIANEVVSDITKMLFCTSLLLCLSKVVYLVRVFRNLNFLVTMISTVIEEIVDFTVLFVIFLFAFAEMNHVLDVDITTYGRVRPIVAHFLNALRTAMGDFATLDPQQNYDIIVDQELDYDDPARWMFSQGLMMFTWAVFAISVFFLFMIFMNFIIAVIGDSFNQVSEYKDAHDYQQRMAMIYEREVHFSPKKFQEDKACFPAILIVRQKKETAKVKNNWQSYIVILKNFIRV